MRDRPSSRGKERTRGVYPAYEDRPNAPIPNRLVVGLPHARDRPAGSFTLTRSRFTRMRDRPSEDPTDVVGGPFTPHARIDHGLQV